MIGIICAMREEVDGFLRGTRSRATDRDGFTAVDISGHEAIIASCGLGKVQASMTAGILIERFGCRALVSAGTAGGLIGTRPMQVIVGTTLVQHDYGRSRGQGQLELYRPGVPPLPDYLSEDFAFKLAPGIRQRFESLTSGMEGVGYGTYASGDTFVNDTATRQRLIELDAVAVDMECAAVAQVAEFHGLPWLVAKGISDEASAASHEDFLAGLSEASRRSALVVSALLPALLD